MGLFRSFFSTVYALLFKTESFSCTLPLTSKTYLKLYERPGLWCSEEELESIVKDLRQVAKETQGDRPVPLYGVLKGDQEDMNRRVISIAYDKKTNEPIGFSAQIYMHVKKYSFKQIVLHLGLIYISPKAQGKSVSYLLAMLPNILLTLKSGLRCSWVSNVTQVPAVLGLVDKNYSKTYPSAKKEHQQTFTHRKLTELIMKDHRHDFGVGEDAVLDLDKQIIKNAYTGGSDDMKKTFEESPKHRDPKINAMCEQNLDYDRGDDYIQLGTLDVRSFYALMKNKKSKQNLVQVSFNLLIFAVFGFLLPIFRWLVSGQNLTKHIKTDELKELIYE